MVVYVYTGFFYPIFLIAMKTVFTYIVKLYTLCIIYDMRQSRYSS